MNNSTQTLSLSQQYIGEDYDRSGAQLLKAVMRSGHDTALRFRDGSFLDITFFSQQKLLYKSEGTPVVIRHVSSSGEEMMKTKFNDSLKPLVFFALLNMLPSLCDLEEVSRQTNQLQND